ncbi:nitroreductase family protein [Saccharopolyspora erythraea]|uniref:nitroreductase family protein n=1 Tax=Saccharopolyspora erythraea TaxID=1836 RepID=UPI001BA857C5|nr:nitroreductase family protein [Saccharopolyspora erythraea]QUG99642.1 nitroreductase family protein [Saccharopolyspora erythraea]
MTADERAHARSAEPGSPAGPAESAKPADSSVPLHPLIAERWSPRALDPAVELTDEQFTALFEAARWAPSWGNTQPARYIAGRRGEGTFDRIHATLSRGNRGWTEPAAALAIGVARVVGDEGEPMPYGEYGLGLASQNLVLQAVAEGLVAHQMAGFDRDAARAEFAIPGEFEPMVAIAVGGYGSPAELPERLQAKEAAPRARKPLSELVFTDTWGEALF